MAFPSANVALSLSKSQLFSAPSRKCGNQSVKRWDPEKSTRIKWETTYASELQSRGLAQDFTGLSELLLGQAQPAQFQSAEQTGYWWGSKVSDDGNWTVLGSVTENANAEMPRSLYYNQIFGDYYNWHAATAESGKFETKNTTVNDSVCPRGWKLPVADYDTSGSWRKLMQAYDYQLDIAANPLAYQPFNFTYGARVSYETGNLNVGSKIGHYWTSEATGISATAWNFYYATTFLRPRDNHQKAAGMRVRCVIVISNE